MCKFSILFFIGMLFFIPKNTVAGDCLDGGGFLDHPERADLMIRGKASAYYAGTASTNYASWLDVEVLEIYRGTVGSLNIQIYEDLMFGQGLGRFSVGTEWIFALNTLGSDDEYIIPGCWINHLTLETSVVGILNNPNNSIIKPRLQQRVRLDKLKKLLNNYEDKVQAGRQQCIDDPASCGITPYWPEASYDPNNGRLYIPWVWFNMPDVLGNFTSYEVRLNQRESSLVFDLDVNSITAHQ